MPKKSKADLRQLGSVLYSVLVPGEGYMKILYGEPCFYYNLPLASATFPTLEEAKNFLAHGKEMLYNNLARMEERYKDNGFPTDFHRERAKRLELILENAIVVRITVEKV